MNKRFLVPAFLQKFDDKLLRNKPNTWAARTHFVLWFAFLFALVLSLFCYLTFFDARQYSSTGSWVTLVGLVAFIGFVFWLIFLFRFNMFKRYGNWFVWDRLKSFLLYFISIGAMVAVCFIPSAIETVRANQQFGNEEIVKDINELNTAACKLEYDMLPLQWRADTCRVVDTLPDVAVRPDVIYDTIVTIPVNKYRVIDTAELARSIISEDSLVKVNDSLYVFFKCPNYLFATSYRADDYTVGKVLSSPEIYYAVLKNYQKPEKASLFMRMEALKTKWAARGRYDYDDYTINYTENDGYETKIKKKYNFSSMNYGIDNAVHKKYQWKNDWEVYLRFFYYITLALTLFIFTFRHSTIKTFFLSLLTAVVLVIITALFMAVNYTNAETSVFSFMVVYYIVFGILGLTIFSATGVRKAIQGIGLNIFLFMTPFMPLVFVALNQAMQRTRYYDEDYAGRNDSYSLYYLIAEIAGGILLLILLEPLFKKLYRKWYAAPEA